MIKETTHTILAIDLYKEILDLVLEQHINLTN